ncbi:pre-mRNA-splicing factor ISY1 homolog [Hydra vulgaris]|uniref:Pre-mRNA-splicing factor ISY1 homolog n=1 Tax=Hydra vulgaris TaxID=6087 RepID=T2M2Z8_HYDVU|nr:pre-mRNA-splicing factor ISY1 homolog [Hydra vulgaris]
MARSAEKAMAILSRWTAMVNSEDKPQDNARRPFLATECNDLKEAEKWRRQIIREVSKKVAQIQNAGMGEFRIRDLNDEINKLLREKRHWEDRIVELNGPNYAKIGPKMLDHEGKELPGNRGYKYFGAARDLPGVRELFEQDPPKAPRKNRAELYRFVDADYYGYRDDDDGLIIPLEKEAEEKARKEAVTDFAKKLDSEGITLEEKDDNIYLSLNFDNDENTDNIDKSFVSHVPVPSQKEVEDMLVRHKKQELLDRYASDILKAQSSEAKALMGL